MAKTMVNQKLYVSSPSAPVIIDLEIALNFSLRLKGLMGRSSLADNAALYIPRCNWIHTCFMRFPIDVVYVDKSLKILSFDAAVTPWRFCAIRWRAAGVIEMNDGAIKRLNLKVGDRLNVGD